MNTRIEPQGDGLPRKYGDPAGYDSYMGHWSNALAPLFLDFASLQHPVSILDIGCGTGNLLVTAAKMFPGARLVGVDPSTALLNKARARFEDSGAEWIEGTAERLPFPDARFDASLSLLVLQEFADRAATLRQMRRVTRPGGVVAACQWDFAQMPVIAALVDALASIDRDMGERLATRSPDLVGSEAELAGAWRDAGFREVSADRIRVARRYTDFEELWKSLLGGSTPSTLMLTALPAGQRETVRRSMRSRFHITGATAGLDIKAEAIVVRGQA